MLQEVFRFFYKKIRTKSIHGGTRGPLTMWRDVRVEGQ
jgi:hypothetical protein